MTTLRQIQALLLGRYVEQASRDVGAALDECRGLRDDALEGTETKAAFRQAAEDLHDALTALDQARRRLNLHRPG
jgi:hypothetical protein